MDNTLPLFAAAAASKPVPVAEEEFVPERDELPEEPQETRQNGHHAEIVPYEPQTDFVETVTHQPILVVDLIHQEHALWLASGGKDGRRAHFHKSDLAHLNLAAYRFSGASMRGIHILDVDLSRADLSGCDLSDSILENVDLRGASLIGASLSGARLHDVNMEGADLSGAVLLNAQGTGVLLSNAKLRGTNLRECDLQNTNFSYTEMQDAVMRGAVFTGSQFDHADLTGSDCRDVVFDHASFAEAQLAGAHFKGASLTSINIQDADFTTALEVTFDMQTQILFEEKRLLKQERAVLEEMGTRLNEERHALDARDEAIALRERGYAIAEPYMAWVVRAFQGICSLWMLVSIALLVLTLTRVAQIGMNKVDGIIAFVGMVLILCFLSLYFALKARYILLNIASRGQKPPKK